MSIFKIINVFMVGFFVLVNYFSVSVLQNFFITYFYSLDSFDEVVYHHDKKVISLVDANEMLSSRIVRYRLALKTLRKAYRELFMRHSKCRPTKIVYLYR
jgi:hypothetical protein